jgi:predicted amidophosphoribosyltransferase
VEWLAALSDLVLPTSCAGCGGPGRLCAACARTLRTEPMSARPDPAPAGLPACFAAGPYEGVLRAAILQYKERGRRGLASELGAALARSVRAGWPDPAVGPVVLVPVPGTAKAIRERQGDHMVRLARSARRELRAHGFAAAVATPLRARPKTDSAGLDREQRAAAAREAFALRAGWARRIGVVRQLADHGAVVLVDDVLTTGSTLAAVAIVLSGAGVAVRFAATLAATERRNPSGGRLSPDARISVSGSRDRGDGVARKG